MILSKAKFTPDQVIKAQRESRDISPLFSLAATRGWVVNATPRPLYPHERDPVPIVQKAM
jgi:hypothetical protein